MLNFTKKTDYALVALASLAEAAPDGPRPQSARAISDRYGVPHSLLMNVLKDLVGTGLVTSTRGAKGGYSLTLSPEEVSVAAIIAALEGPIAITECTTETPHECSYEASCRLRGNWQQINNAVRSALEGITLADMSLAAPPARTTLVTLG